MQNPDQNAMTSGRQDSGSTAAAPTQSASPQSRQQSKTSDAPKPQRPPMNTQRQKKKAPGPKTAATAKTDAAGAQLGAVVTRNEFYRDRYRTLVKIALFQSFAIVGIIIALMATIIVNEPKREYFATTEDGRQIPMVPLSQPNLSKPALLSWATQSATEVMTFGFNDYKRRLQEASRHFTRDGWLSFTRALQRAEIINLVTQNKQAVSAAPRSAPVLLSEGVVNGRYQWEIELPMLVTTAYGGASTSQTWRVRLIIVRVPTLESPNGVGISQWLARTG
jgi:intracellular multiplication protein IcmL